MTRAPACRGAVKTGGYGGELRASDNPLRPFRWFRMTIIPKNWASFQHYKDRSPPWIRLHKHLLDDFDFHSLPVASRALAPMLWLLASEAKDPKTGEIDANPRKLAFRLRMTEHELSDALKPLIDNGFFIANQDAIKTLAPCEQSATPEAEAEAYTEREAEADVSAPEVSGQAPKGSSKPKTSEQRGSRLPTDWKPSDEQIAWARKERPDINAEREAANFRDYWIAKPGAGGRKVDWSATWRSWIRNARSFGKTPEPERRLRAL